MNKIKAIRTEEDYRAALELLEVLMDQSPDPDSEAGDQLNILSVLIEKYEADNFREQIPTAVDAIKFRMEQEDLKPVDLVPYLGSRSRVSEILAGKRALTVDMIRALEEGLGIPAKALLKQAEPSEDTIFQSWDKKLLEKMAKRGYFGNAKLEPSNQEDLLESFFSGFSAPLQVHALLRQSSYRSAPTTDRQALAAWATHITKEALKINAPAYAPGSITLEFMQKVAKLSTDPNGPVLAQDMLRKNGIILVIEPALPKTRLDGAAVLTNAKQPIIGVTLRHDRLDNFWFTLMHELAHIALHYGNESTNLFYDELDEVKGMAVSKAEQEADRLASEALVPAHKWEISPARLIPSPMAARSLANEIGVDISIIAGKIRFESGKWTYLNSLIAGKSVRQLFPGKDWD